MFISRQAGFDRRIVFAALMLRPLTFLLSKFAQLGKKKTAQHILFIVVHSIATASIMFRKQILICHQSSCELYNVFQQITSSKMDPLEPHGISSW